MLASSSMRGPATAAAPSTSGRPLLPARAPPLGRRRAAARCRAEPPTVAVTFVDGATGAELAQLDLPSGEQLRGQMLANKVDLYTAWNKVWSCGGAGQCGTCIVDVKSAPDGCLSDRSETEQKKLRGKPATWRLACQTFVGDEETPGQRVTIATKPK